MSESAPVPSPTEISTAIRSGNRRAAAQLISRIEARDAAVAPVLQLLYAAGANTPALGITGPPGAGKSTLADQLIAHWRARGERVAVLAVDPSSPISGGALLGDRVRMNRHNTDADVFIRSMSARGHLGGLARATGDALIVLDAMGFDRILIETVGTGQSEVDILHHVHTVLVVQTPVGGDAIQAMKSGLLEIADVLVVNKCDAPGADRTAAQLREMIESNNAMQAEDWMVPIVKTQAAANIGIADVDNAVLAHLDYLAAHPAHAAKRQRVCNRAVLIERLAELLRMRHSSESTQNGAFERALDDILQRRCDPGSAAAQLLSNYSLESHR